MTWRLVILDMNTIVKRGIQSGEELYAFLIDAGVCVSSTTALEGSENVIKLPDLTTFNWKKRDNIIRVNCKTEAMNVIEAKTGLKHFDNGSGDPTRPYSFLVESFSDLIDVIYALKTIPGNGKVI